MKTAMILWLAACNEHGFAPGGSDPDTNEHSGVWVGNPGSVRVQAAPMVDLSWVAGEAEDPTLTLYPCDGAESVEVALPDTDWGLGKEAVELPTGEYCSVALRLTGALLEVRRSDGAASAVIALGAHASELVPTGDVIAVDGEAFVFELGTPGWLDAEAVGLDMEDVVWEEKSEVAALIVERLMDSSLVVDADADGALTQSERDEGTVARPPK